jgi:hypothetical protein
MRASPTCTPSKQSDCQLHDIPASPDPVLSLVPSQCQKKGFFLKLAVGQIEFGKK